MGLLSGQEYDEVARGVFGAPDWKGTDAELYGRPLPSYDDVSDAMIEAADLLMHAWLKGSFPDDQARPPAEAIRALLRAHLAFQELMPADSSVPIPDIPEVY